MLEDLLDLGFRLAFRGAYRLLSVYWYVRRPATHGVNVAVWCDGSLLVLRNSYRPGISLPGGGVGRRESRREAAARELREEVGVLCPAELLRPALSARSNHEHKDDVVHIFELSLAQRPHITIDRREVVWASFLPLDEVRALAGCPQLRAYLDQLSARDTPR